MNILCLIISTSFVKWHSYKQLLRKGQRVKSLSPLEFFRKESILWNNLAFSVFWYKRLHLGKLLELRFSACCFLDEAENSFQLLLFTHTHTHTHTHIYIYKICASYIKSKMNHELIFTPWGNVWFKVSIIANIYYAFRIHSVVLRLTFICTSE